MKKTAATLSIISAMTVSACGFKPIYATPDNAVSPVIRQVSIGAISAPEEAHLALVGALRERIVVGEGLTPKYNLEVVATENAQALAVQIDATVTRYNYRMRARYSLRDLESGSKINGSAEAITSYNIVSSQYSTLFAERTAREKAARLLAEEIERDILLRLSNPDSPDSVVQEPTEFIDPESIGRIRPQRDPFGGEDQPFVVNEEIDTNDSTENGGPEENGESQ